jgi:hypothetical protein
VIPIPIREQPYSPKTVLRAVRWLERRGLLECVDRGGGRGRVGLYRVRWKFLDKALSAETVDTHEEGSKAKPAFGRDAHRPASEGKPSPPAEVFRLMGWLARSPDQARVLSPTERRKSAAALRRQVGKPLADALLGVLRPASERGRPLTVRLARDLHGALWSGRDGPGANTTDPGELFMRACVGLKELAATGDRARFREILQQGQRGREVREAELRANAKGEERRREAWRRMLDCIGDTGRCPRCGVGVSAAAAIEGEHPCARSLHRRRYELGDARARLLQELAADEARREARGIAAEGGPAPEEVKALVGSLLARMLPPTEDRSTTGPVPWLSGGRVGQEDSPRTLRRASGDIRASREVVRRAWARYLEERSADEGEDLRGEVELARRRRTDGED